ncbi:MAG: adenylyltransferase/cytidyltransferase family protein [Kiritimatiellae bacterium]|nr:adenylyltransferase/cytidyltransferase family protein [Kiritimatiellia bacterium]
MNRTSEEKLLTLGEVVERAAELREQSRTIVTANGSFDIMHAGHVAFLEQARAKGDVLIIGINSDASVKAYKSPSRPIISEEFRARMVAALECVDFVFLFDETDPREWLKQVKPDIHVNGTEYGKDCIERDVVEACGGRISLVQSVGGLSTSAVIARIVALERQEG